jgi:hypothetical protein
MLAKVIVADELADERLRPVLPLRQGAPIPVYAIAETAACTACVTRFPATTDASVSIPGVHMPLAHRVR